MLGGDGYSFVLTRLHARYGKDGAPNDLVFKTASPIVGGREQRDGQGHLEERAKPDSTNNFQGRYAIRHAWTGTIACQAPVRGRWGGPPSGAEQPQGCGCQTSDSGGLLMALGGLGWLTLRRRPRPRGAR